jgi:hypothetical protein
MNREYVMQLLNPMRAIDTVATASATALLWQGWTERGARYDIGTYHGDAEALEERLGRSTTREERVILEIKIREQLDVAYQGDGSLMVSAKVG